MMHNTEIKDLLEFKYAEFAQRSFIASDPIQIPHQFTRKPDIEIAGLFAAIFAWGQRVTIINKANDLLERMDRAPFDFIKNHTDEDLKALDGFVHRTFNAVDLKGFLSALQLHYQRHESLEGLFIHPEDQVDLKNGLHQFKQFFVDAGIEPRTYRHLPDPFKGSAAKRINMMNPKAAQI